MGIVLIIIGIACALYGVSVMMIGSGTWFFAVWYALGAAFIVVGVAVQAGWWQALPTIVKRGVEIVAAVVLCVVLVTQVFIFRDFNDTGEPGLDYLIVLGAQVHEQEPSAVLAYRLDAAYDYLMENEGTLCIVSGGQGPNEPAPEAHIMADYLIRRGLPAERIIQEDRSLNTAQNIANCKKLIDSDHDRIGLVTNNFHLFRSLSIARKAGMENVSGIAAYSTPGYLPNNLLRESFSIVKDVVCGNM